MMTFEESMRVLERIHAHHGNAPITQLRAECFHEELRDWVTLPLALDAVREFYASDTTGRWMGAGDVNALAARMRSRLMPSDAEVDRMAFDAGLTTGEACWQFRRSLFKALRRGVPMAEARGVAERQASAPLLDSPSGAGLLAPGSDGIEKQAQETPVTA